MWPFLWTCKLTPRHISRSHRLWSVFNRLNTFQLKLRLHWFIWFVVFYSVWDSFLIITAAAENARKPWSLCCGTFGTVREIDCWPDEIVWSRCSSWFILIYTFIHGFTVIFPILCLLVPKILERVVDGKMFGVVGRRNVGAILQYCQGRHRGRFVHNFRRAFTTNHAIFVQKGRQSTICF